MHRMVVIAISIAACSVCAGQELLTNTSFDDPPLAGTINCGSPTAHDFQPVVMWFKPGGANWSGRQGDVFIPQDCDLNGHASLQTCCGNQVVMYQPVTGLDSAKTYLFTGEWTLGDFTPPAVFTAELREGTDETGGLIAQTAVTLSAGKYNWLPFAVSGSPSGIDMTVVLRVSDSGGNTTAMHVDNVSLTENTCSPPTVASFAPEILFRDTVYDDAIAITGANFVQGSTSVKLEGDDVPDILATDVQVAGGGTSLTCDLTIPAGAAIKARTVVVEVAGCGGNALAAATFVLNSGPFRNGGFEQPISGYNACPVQPHPAPDWWDAVETNGYGGLTKLYRDDLPAGAPFLPSCPPPALAPDPSWHYAATSSDAGAAGSPQDFIFQTFQVTDTQEYTLSGFFAGGGNNIVQLEMRDGTSAGALLAPPEVVHVPGGSYDWSFAAVSGVAQSTLMTIGWRVRVQGDAPHASYADAIEITPCNSGITVTGITPGSGVNDGSVVITDLAGTGFSDAAGAPKVILNKAGNLANATNVQVVSATRITCEFDLTGLPSGRYDVIVVQDGCIGKLSDTEPVEPLFLVIAETFVNGSFEDPTAPENCGSNTYGTPTGWNFTDELLRDSSVWVPTCPGNPDALHYGSMTTGEGELEQAWQTIETGLGSTVTFSGQFAGGGDNTVKIKLLDGDETSTTILAETTVYTSGNVFDAYDWTPAEVQAAAVSQVMTVMWEMSGTSGGNASASHADALTLMVDPCNEPFADADDDGDVDQEDYGVLQECLAGPTAPVPTEPAYCTCFDRNVDDHIDQQDATAFEACASAPGVPANPACDG